MQNDNYAAGTVQALLSTDLITENTKAVLQARLNAAYVTSPVFFSPELFDTLRAVCHCLVPQPDIYRTVDLAGGLDKQLAEGKGDGWRYNALPPDGIAFTKGLCGINETAVSMFGRPFHSLTTGEKHTVLAAIQGGKAEQAIWHEVSPILFFEELLAAIVILYYSHPFAKDDIGDVSMADAHGWQKTGMNEHKTISI